MIEIADVLADEGLAVDHQRDGIFQIGAQGQDRPLRRKRGDRAGRVAASRAQHDRAETPARATESSTRRAMGRSPMRKASAIPARRASASSSSIGDRLAGTVRAGHHQHFGSARGEQQMVQRRVGQHDAEFVVVGRDSG